LPSTAHGHPCLWHISVWLLQLFSLRV
jgi:hypothetical protein